MSLLDHLNLYFGTEHQSINKFIKDFKNGELGEDYYDDSDKLTHLLMFLVATSMVEEGSLN